jgi:hypothetical protein
MMELILVGMLLFGLFLSTSSWALSQARAAEETVVEGDLAKARLWASVVPALTMLVLTAAGVIALLSPMDGGVASLQSALTSRPIVTGLLVCAGAELYAAYLCARLWAAGRVAVGRRLHLMLHVAATYAAILALLIAPGRAG